MRKRWRYGPLRSPAAALATRQCCRTCSTRSHQTRSWAALLPSFGSNAPAGQWMEPTTRANATILVQPAMPIPPRKNAKMWKPDIPSSQRSGAVLKILGARSVAKPHRIPPPQPRRDKYALCETPRSAPRGARLRSTSCGDPDPRPDPEWLHSSWHTAYRRRRLNPSRAKESGTSGQFVQKSPLEPVHSIRCLTLSQISPTSAHMTNVDAFYLAHHRQVSRTRLG